MLTKHIPNAITSGNLFCGCLAIMAALNGNIQQAAWFMGAAAVLDFFDGFAARLFKVSGELGKQLDSLADVVSFGVAPAFIFFVMAESVFEQGSWLPYISFLIAIFSAIRLAKFNLDTRQTDSFIGMPTPANAMFIGGLTFMANQNFIGDILQSTIFFIVFPLLSAYLMLAELPLIALKFKQFKWAGNEFRFILIFSCVVCLLIFKFAGVSICMVLYILLSVLQNILNKNNKA